MCRRTESRTYRNSLGDDKCDVIKPDRALPVGAPRRGRAHHDPHQGAGCPADRGYTVDCRYPEHRPTTPTSMSTTTWPDGKVVAHGAQPARQGQPGSRRLSSRPSAARAATG
ncbi:hypothetical protein ACU4GD_32715 [Cupriavidus basilensis]